MCHFVWLPWLAEVWYSAGDNKEAMQLSSDLSVYIMLFDVAVNSFYRLMN